jgi:hypothetical protein
MMQLFRTLLSMLASTVATAIALPAFLVALPFALVARTTVRLGRWLEPETVAWDRAIEHDPEIGWRVRPGLDLHVRDFNGDPFHVTTDGDGWRGPGSLEESALIVFGDSFAFGSGIDSHLHFAELRHPHPVKCIGAPAYNMVQSLLWMRRLGRRLAGKTVVWLVYPANDLDDNLLQSTDRYRMPFVRQGADGWVIETRHIDDTPWPFIMPRRNIERWVDLCSGKSGADRMLDACGWLIDQAAQACREAGADLVVMSVPELSPLNAREVEGVLAHRPDRAAFDPGLPDRRIADRCGASGIPFIALADTLTTADYLAHDVHWNARGHERVAEVLRQLGDDRNAGPVRVEAHLDREPIRQAR